MENTTIAAIATPIGSGGIGIVKISGPDAIAATLPLFRPFRSISEFKSHHLYYGHIVDPDEGVVLDEVLFVIMKKPHSYTCEDVVEIHAHGSASALNAILELVLKSGRVHLAEPGEFTKRAFLNGRIDLAQAEAVVDIINSQTRQGLLMAAEQLKGGLSDAIQRIIENLKDLLINVEAAIDFPEDVEIVLQPEMVQERLTQQVVYPLRELLEQYDEGHVYREGITAVILGRPNVGKSSLMNRLLKKERSIVTGIPGTTRDIIEDDVNIRGIPVKLVDTAGLHKTEDEVETIGIRLAKETIEHADLVLFMVDVSIPLTEEDLDIYNEIQHKKGILVLNKIDLPIHPSLSEISTLFPEIPQVRISALYGNGIEELKDTIFETVTGQTDGPHLPSIVPNLRHRMAIKKALSSAYRALKNLKESVFLELIAIDLRDALDTLGEILGITTTQDLLEEIFSRFCIGK